MLCGEASLVNTLGDCCKAITLYCRSWGCEHCRPKRHAQLRELAANGAPDKFITLTLRNDGSIAKDAAARKLADCWRLIVKRAQRKFGIKHIPYLAVYEAHKSGFPHLHILARSKYIPQKWLSEQMIELTGSHRQDIRAVKGKRMVASYISKYVGKAPGKFGKQKRYWHTKDWDILSDEVKVFDGTDPAGWRVVLAPLIEIVRLWPGQGIKPLAVAKGVAFGHKYKRPPKWEAAP